MTTLGIIWLACLLWMMVSLIFYRPRKMGGVFDQNLIKDRTKTNFNLIALYFNLRNGELIDKDFLTRFKPLTPLQKEIREEERTIKQLEAQKVDIRRLAELKRKREALFEEVGDADFKPRVYTPEQTNRILNEKCSKEKYRLRYNGIEINKLFATEEEAFTYAEAASDNNYFEAEVRRINL